ncbi:MULTISPECIES: DUF975 family protein [unclassified Exiguobacterium]|uniref:DUF975 family protein n=1 Tax=unclassified Exiguobacterium TaxID=2644629 RepID=UPI001BEB73E0|nr:MULTISPECIES: DUF975 family protein [unclassified Exiguobacterium]
MRSEWKQHARQALKGKWWLMAGLALLFLIINGIPQWFAPEMDVNSPEPFTSADLTLSFVSNVLQILIAPLAIGWSWLALNVSRGNGASLSTMFKPFQMRYVKHVITSFVMGVFLVLWTLLLVVPGIIKGFSYSLTPYILRDQPELSALESITESRRLMDGHKMEAFMLFLSFFGWFLVGLLTLGIGFFFIGPYFSTTYATFYDSIRDNHITGADEPVHGTEQGF